MNSAAIEFRPLGAWDVQVWENPHPGVAIAIAPELRDADKRELELASGVGIERALFRSIQMSDWSAVFVSGGRTASVVGLVRGALTLNSARIWMVATDRIYEIPKIFMGMSRLVLREAEQSYGRLFNYVWDEHEDAKNWLRWLGFTLEEPQAFGASGAPFRYFWKCANPQPLQQLVSR